MKIIVGLGNPGKPYKNNRHNVGQMFVDYLKSQKAKVKSVKTDCFMNQSGVFVKKLIKNWELKIENLIIVHDDLDIPIGKFKIQKGVGPKLHNGLESIEQVLGTKDFWRVRIGVDNRIQDNGPRPERSRRVDGETYVLQDFTSEEKNIINQTFPKIFNRLVEFSKKHY